MTGQSAENKECRILSPKENTYTVLYFLGSGIILEDEAKRVYEPEAVNNYKETCGYSCDGDSMNKTCACPSQTKPKHR